MIRATAAQLRYAHRARTVLIEARDLAMKTARTVRANPLEFADTKALLTECVRSARACQHDALRFARQDRR